MITHDVKKRVEQLALAIRCPECQTVGEWRINKVTEGVNLISKTRITSARRDFDNPVFLASMICLRCGFPQEETIEPQSVN
jgi:hypothetical protein